MGRKAGAPASHSLLNTQLFSVVGVAYIPDQISDFSPHTIWTLPKSKQQGGVGRLLVLCALAALLVVLAHTGTIVHATMSQTQPASVSHLSGGSPWIGAVGGTEVNRW